jgi:hypothetical protein
MSIPLALRQDHNGILAGEPTGGRPNHYDEGRSLTLSGTGLSLTYSTKYFKKCAVDRASLDPNVRADNTIADYVAGPDTMLELALKAR